MRTPARFERRLFLKIAAVAAIFLSLGTVSFRFDAPVRAEIIENQPKGWKHTPFTKTMGKISRHGDWPQLMLAGAAFLALAIWLKNRPWTEIMVAAMLASTAAGILANLSRLTTGRPRPSAVERLGDTWYGPWHEGKLLVGIPDYNAFPSGHTATAMGFAAPILYARPLVGVPFVAAAAAIAFSRMWLGRHHLSDVVVSTMLALIVGWLVLRWVRTDGERVWLLSVAKFKEFRRRGS